MQEQLIKTLLTFLKVNSITGNEKELADILEGMCYQKFNKTTPHPTLSRINNNIIIHGPKKEGRKTISLVGHLDTVPGKAFGGQVKVNDTQVIGLGASDMKGGLAVMFELIDGQIFSKSQYNINFIFYEGEEGPDVINGLYPIFKEMPQLKETHFAFILEPTDRAIHLGSLGSVGALIKFKGKSSHSARPWEGVNAIHKAADFLKRLSLLEPRLVSVDGLDYKEVMSATMASGGTARNVIPGEFVVTLNTRYSPTSTKDDAIKWISEVVGDDAEIEVTGFSQSGLIPKNNPILDSFRAKFNLPEHPKQAYTDVSIFSRNGVDAINYGPGLTNQAHQDGEYILIDDLVQTYDNYKSFLLG